MPKGAVIPHRTTEHRLTFLSTEGGLRHGTHNRSLGMVPLSHAIGFYCVFLATLAYNGTYYVMSAFSPAAAVDMIERHRITYLFSIPTLYGAMVSAPNYRPERMASLELVLYGGSPIHSPLLERLAREWPAKIRTSRAPPRSCSSAFPRSRRQSTLMRENFGRGCGSCATAAAPRTACIRRSRRLIVDAEADVTFQGYLNRPDATAEKLREGWYFTGDVCVLREDGDLELIGRVDDLIRSGGESVYPEEVEALLATHPTVREVCVIGIPDDKWGEMVLACVVFGRAGAKCEELDGHLKASSLARVKAARYLALTRAAKCANRSCAELRSRRQSRQ